MSKSHLTLSLITAGLILLPQRLTWGAPSGFSSSNATLHQTDEHLIIQSGHHAIINWDSFSLSKDELIRFVQADGTSCVVNKVTGITRSELLGQLLSNGSVCLINPNGIFIGPDAYIQTAGFIASTLDLVDSDLSNHKLRFTSDNQSSIINQGTIHCPIGDLFLIAKTIDNSGTLKADQGRQGLLSGSDILISPDDAPLFLIRESEFLDTETLEENPYALAIRHSGTIEASDAYLVADVGLTEIAGQITAPGGDVHVLGDAVHLLKHTTIDVSHGTHAGTILVGGDYQGNNPAIKNAKFVWAGEDTELKADALDKGDGGKVILWGDKATFHYGTISIRGGSSGGNGGFAEVSGKTLEYRGFTDGGAPCGRPGVLLLDPTDVTIGGTATSGTWSACGPPVDYEFVAGTQNFILNTDLATQLQSCSVTVDTVGTGGSGTNEGSIIVSSAIGGSGTWTAATTLELHAASFITTTANITNESATTGFTAVSLTADGTSSGAITGVTIGTNSVITTSGGDVVVNGIGTGANMYGVFFINGGKIVTGAGNVAITGTTSGIVGVRTLLSTNTITSTSGNIVISGRNSGTATAIHGVQISSSPWAAGTTGTLTFDTCTATSGGVNSYGIAFDQPVSNIGSIVATNSITGGTGFGSSGCSISGTISVTGTNSIIAISATSTSSSGVVNTAAGITINSGCTVSAIAGSITLIGTGTTGTAYNNHGIANAGTITTTTGAITLIGSAPTVIGTNTGFGVSSTGGISSTSGNINISGISAAPTPSATAAGVSIAAISGTDSIRTSGILTFATCTAGTSGANIGHGVTLSGSYTLGGLIATQNILSGTGVGVGFNATSNMTMTITGASPNSFQINATSRGTTGTCHGIALSGTINLDNGAFVSLNGTGGASSGSGGAPSYGVSLSSTTTLITTTGTITLAGVASGTASSSGISANNAIITSTSGDILISGTSTATGSSSSGVLITNVTTTGTLTFTNCVASGGGSSSHGVNFGGVNSVGSLVATNNILSGTGSSAAGASLSGTISITGDSSRSCQIAATARGASSSAGISIAGRILAPSGAFVLLNGTGSSGGGQGINAASGTITTSTGPITLIGTSTGTGAGVVVGSSATSSTSGADISFSGASVGNIGVSVQSASGRDTISTTGTLTFINCTTTNNGGSAVNVAGTINVGSLIATNNILSGTASGAVGFNNTATISITGDSTRSCQITATSQGLAGAANGIAITRILALNGAFVSLNGTGGPSTATSHGISNNTITTSTGSITLLGVATGSGTAAGVGVTSSAAITSTSGDVYISGTSTAPGSSAHGVSLAGANAVVTGGTLTLANCSSTTGATFTAGNGVNLSGTYNVSNLFATSNIRSSTGSASIGFNSTGAITITGTSTSSCQIAATSRGTAGASHGISLTSNGIRATSGAPITLSGTSGTSGTASHGVSITGVSTTVSANRVQASSGTITINGISQATGGVSHGVNIALTVGASPPTAITGSTAPIIITGTTSSPGASSMGVFVGATGWTTSGNTGTVSITGATTGGASPSFPIGLVGGTQTSIATGGPLTCNNLVGITSATNSVAITAAGPTSFQGAPISVQGGGVATGTAAGCRFSVSSTLNLTFLGSILTPGDTGNGGSVTLTCPNGSVIVGINGTTPNGGITTTGGSAAGTGGDISITPSGAYSGGLPVGLIALGGSLDASGGAGGTAGAITLNAGRSTDATVATIVSSLDGNDISMTAETITFGTYEALTALGNITLTATTMTIGDVVAKGALSINATTANLTLHGDISLLSSVGDFYTSPATHLYGGTGYNPNSTTFVPDPPEFGVQSEISSGSLLVYSTDDDLILNYDIHETPAPPAPPETPNPFPDRTRQRLIYELLIADAELSDRLPFRWCALPAFYYHCEIKRRPEEPALHSYEELK